MGPGSEDIEQDIDDVFLTHEDGDKKVGNDSVGNFSRIRLVSSREADKY